LAQRKETAPLDQRLLDELTLVASQAAAAILSVHGSALRQRDKADRSPVTAADEASEKIILDGLSRLLPDVPVVSEEAALPAPAALGNRFFLVDPLDGTREFIAGDSEYTVNIALIVGGHPVAGIIAAPALGIVWRGIVGAGAERMKLQPGAAVASATERTPIRARPKPPGGLVAMTSRSHPEPATGAYLDRIAGVQRMVSGSSLKFCRIAEGAADIYPRLVSLSEWDVAAGHALVAAAGGTVTTVDGQTVTYGRSGFRMPPFIAWGEAPG
jgi:3'(2'), 5'-bisphosphate nucleotidase